MLILRQGFATVDWTGWREWRHQSTCVENGSCL